MMIIGFGADGSYCSAGIHELRRIEDILLAFGAELPDCARNASDLLEKMVRINARSKAARAV